MLRLGQILGEEVNIVTDICRKHYTDGNMHGLFVFA